MSFATTLREAEEALYNMSLSKHYLSTPAPAKPLWGMFCQWEQGDSVEIQGLAK